MTTTETCPPLEDIAAFLDGTLEQEERARVMEHLASCPACYEIFIGVARFQEDEREEEQEVATAARVVRFPPLVASPAARRWLPLAVAAVLAFAIGLPVYRYVSQPPLMEVASLLRPIEGTPNLAERTWQWESFRGEGDDRQDASQDSFLIGAWLVDRQVASQEKDKAESAQDLSRRIYIALEAQGMTEEAEPFKKEAQENLGTPVRREAFLGSLRETAQEREESLSSDISVLLPEYLAFGKWTEAARIAAAARSVAFFRNRDHRRLPSYLLRKEGENLHPEVRKNLQQVRQLLDQGELREADFDALEERLGEIIEAYKPLASDGGEIFDDPDTSSSF